MCDAVAVHVQCVDPRWWSNMKNGTLRCLQTYIFFLTAKHKQAAELKKNTFITSGRKSPIQVFHISPEHTLFCYPIMYYVLIDCMEVKY